MDKKESVDHVLRFEATVGTPRMAAEALSVDYNGVYCRLRRGDRLVKPYHLRAMAALKTLSNAAFVRVVGWKREPELFCED